MILSVLFFLQACATVPVTGRKQLDLVPDSELLTMSYSEYSTVMKKSKLSTDQEKVDMVRRVGKRIASAA